MNKIKSFKELRILVFEVLTCLLPLQSSTQRMPPLFYPYRTFPSKINIQNYNREVAETKILFFSKLLACR